MLTKNEIKSLINELETFDLANITNEQYVEYKYIFGKLFAGETNFPRATLNTKDTVFVRARKNDNYFLFKNLTDLWFPPFYKVRHGRLNFHNDPIFYSSNDAGTAILEINPNQLQFVTLIYFKIRTEKLTTFSLGVNEYDGQVFSASMDIDKIKYEFLVNHIKKVVPQNLPGLYTPTMLISKGVRHENFDAFIYKSVATKLIGLNFAFKPEFINHNFIFDSARTIQVLQIHEDETYFVKCIAEAKRLKSNKDFVWEFINDCSGHEFSFNHP